MRLYWRVFNALIATSAQVRTVTRRGVVYTFGHDAVIDFLETHTAPGDEIFVYPYRPDYYFLAAARNPTKLSILMYNYNTEVQLHDAVKDLEDSTVRYALWDIVMGGEQIQTYFPSYRPPPEERLVIEPYLTQHYNLVGYKDGFLIMERKAPNR